MHVVAATTDFQAAMSAPNTKPPVADRRPCAQLVEMNDFYAPRRCLREPIAEIFGVAKLLEQALEAHIKGDRIAAAEFIRQADKPDVRAWTESLWGSAKANPDQPQYIRYRPVADSPPSLEKHLRQPVRMPTASERTRLIERYGYNCAFCGIPLIRKEVRSAFNIAYPDAAYWGDTNVTQHAGFQCLWLQYDHLLPHSRGGDSSIDNVVITCAPCNYGRWQWTLDELGLIDPRTRDIIKTDWDGLERMISHTKS
jgi:5-methylcytosine-specific restriction endonuclease McrA